MYNDPSLALGTGRDGGQKAPSVAPSSAGRSMHGHDGGKESSKAAMPVWEKGEESQSVVQYVSPCVCLP